MVVSGVTMLAVGVALVSVGVLGGVVFPIRQKVALYRLMQVWSGLLVGYAVVGLLPWLNSGGIVVRAVVTGWALLLMLLLGVMLSGLRRFVVEGW